MALTSPFYIFDLDGTLADATGRLHYITGPEKDWDAFFRACAYDTPITPNIRLMRQLLRSGARVEIWTGRSDMVRMDTVNWLSNHAAVPSALIMRKHGDHTPDEKLKETWLHNMPAMYRRRLIGVFEDRKRVVDMWRRNDVMCYQVAEGEF